MLYAFLTHQSGCWTTILRCELVHVFDPAQLQEERQLWGMLLAWHFLYASHRQVYRLRPSVSPWPVFEIPVEESVRHENVLDSPPPISLYGRLVMGPHLRQDTTE